MKKTIRIMLVEDNAEYREVINFAMKRSKTMELCGQFGTAEIALRSLQDRSSPVPDLVLLDLRLPGMDGLEALPRFREAVPGVRVIILTQSDHEGDVLHAIQQGASGYLLKSSSMEEITGGIQTVMDGGASLDAGVARFVLNTLQAKMPKTQSENLLTGRELETLTLLAEGLVKKQIADRLDISPTTVATYVANIYDKLHVQNAPAAVSRAYRVGILP
jgi:DNA-binding NarL/FixJ family response regulator